MHNKVPDDDALKTKRIKHGRLLITSMSNMGKGLDICGAPHKKEDETDCS